MMVARIASMKLFFKGRKADATPEAGSVSQPGGFRHGTKHRRPAPIEASVVPQHTGLSDDSGSEGLSSPCRDLPVREKKLPPPPYHITYETSQDSMSAPFSPDHVGL